VKDLISTSFPEAILQDETSTTLVYQVLPDSSRAVPKIIRYLEHNPDEYIKGWGITNTTIEDVFLRVIKEANPFGYNA
jgi:hypothetical protein